MDKIHKKPSTARSDKTVATNAPQKVKEESRIEAANTSSIRRTKVIKLHNKLPQINKQSLFDRTAEKPQRG